MGISFNVAGLLSGNGIDVNSVVSEIQAAESGQMTAWQGDVTTLKTQATAIGSISTDLTSLQTAVQALSNPTGVLTQLAAGSSEPTIVSATAESGATAATYNVVVTNLATAGTLYTGSVANANTSILTSPATTGDFSIQIGAVKGVGGTTADIPITAGSNDTLTTLANSINTLSATNKWGITASVLNDASGSRLAVYSQETGSAGALSLNNNTTNLTVETPVGGADAVFSINGIPYSSSTNTVTGAISDVPLNLISAAPGTSVEILVSANTANITNAVNSFVTAYNTVIGDINSQFAYSATTNTQGPLGPDTYLRNLQSSLLSDMGYATTDATSVSSGLTNLAALGIVMNDDGTLTVNQTATDTAPAFPDVLAANLSALQNFFQNANSTGFANNLSNDLSSLTNPTKGALNEDLAANQNQQTDLTTEITNFQTQLAAQKVQLDQEFDAVNSSLEQYPILLQEVTAELGSITSGTLTMGTTPSTNTTPVTGTSTSGTSGTTSTTSTSG